ncbi:hypothetical protein LJC14_04650, partial [Treponema sp. OttesenSCG-928-L16]|nr:hypothetical protein [Treponema sp. OttesenSCG-928-L16]
MADDKLAIQLVQLPHQNEAIEAVLEAVAGSQGEVVTENNFQLTRNHTSLEMNNANPVLKPIEN